MLNISHVTMVFNKDQSIENQKVALNDLSLEVKKGEFVTVIGSNGSGKTTLMNIIAGTFPPDVGTISIDGTDVTRLLEHKRAAFVGRVFQDPMLGTCPNMSMEENLSLAFRRGKKQTLRWGFSKENLSLYKEKLADLNLKLEDRLPSKVGLLSGGQRQALTLIMATLNNPKLLLLDEHTAALDPKTAKIVLDITAKIIASQKITTIMITHNMRDAIKYGSRLIMLSEGRIILDISGEEKQNLTIEQLLKKFDKTDVEFDDKLILSK